MKSECEHAGLVFDRGRVRVARLAEAVRILKATRRGEMVTFSQGGVGRDVSGFTAEGTDERLRWIREAAGGRCAGAGR